MGSPLCTASRGARLLWCQTVMSSVQGSTMRTIARMSRLFGISKAGCTHSSSLPGQRQGQGGVATEERRQHKGEKNRHWAGRHREAEAEHWPVTLTSAHTHPLRKQVCRVQPDGSLRRGSRPGQGQEPSEVDTCKKEQWEMTRDVGMDHRDWPTLHPRHPEFFNRESTSPELFLSG